MIDSSNDDIEVIRRCLADTFEVTGLIGTGGMGSVYRARHLLMDRICAIKILRMEPGQDSNALKRFQNEARVLSRMKHSGIATLHTFGIANNIVYLEMELVGGQTLHDIIAEQELVEPRRAIPWFVQICDALFYAHQHTVIHRDLKPANIMVVAGESIEQPELIKVLDFGIARIVEGESTATPTQNLTQSGRLIGSPAYMSPEQCSGASLDQRSDVYSLGCLMYETLCGAPPFVRETALATMTAHLSEPPPPHRALSKDMFSLLRKCLRKNPDDRWQTMQELRIALEDVNVENTANTTFGASPRVRTGLILLATCIALVVALVALRTILIRYRPGPQEGSVSSVLPQAAAPPPTLQQPLAGLDKAKQKDLAITRFRNGMNCLDQLRYEMANREFQAAELSARQSGDNLLAIRSAYYRALCAPRHKSADKKKVLTEALEQTSQALRNDTTMEQKLILFSDDLATEDADFSAELLVRIAKFNETKGQHAQALNYYRTAFNRYRDLTKSRLSIFASAYLGLLLISGRDEEANEAATRMNQLVNQGHFVKRRGSAATIRFKIGQTYLKSGRTEKGVKFLRSALATLDSADHLSEEANREMSHTQLLMQILSELARERTDSGHPEEAFDIFKQADKRAGYRNLEDAAVMLLPEKGHAFNSLKQYSKALNCYQQARENYFKNRKDTPPKAMADPHKRGEQEANILRGETICLLNLKKYDSARSLARKIVDIEKPFEPSYSHRQELASDILLLARIERAMGEEEDALLHYQKAFDLFASCGKQADCLVVKQEMEATAAVKPSGSKFQ